MKKFWRSSQGWIISSILLTLLALGLIVQMPEPTQAQISNSISCGQSVVVSGATATTTQLVALNATKRIYVCGFVLTGGGATTAKLVYGTGASCGTGTTDLTASLELADNTSIPYGGGGAPVLTPTPVGRALCWTNSAAVQVSGVVTYTQF